MPILDRAPAKKTLPLDPLTGADRRVFSFVFAILRLGGTLAAMNSLPLSRRETLALSTRRIFSPLLLACALAILGTVFLATSASAGGAYCALAYSKSTHRWGDAYSHPTRASAERMALKGCGTRDAFIVGWGRNCYIALAAGRGTTWGFGRGPTRASAERRALAGCPDRHHARIVRYAYSFE